MKIIKNLTAIVLCIATLSLFFARVYADGIITPETEATALDISNEHKKSGLSVTAE